MLLHLITYSYNLPESIMRGFSSWTSTKIFPNSFSVIQSG